MSTSQLWARASLITKSPVASRLEQFTQDDGHTLGAPEIYEYLSRLMYGRRSKMNPLWNSLLVGGFKDGKSFLGYVDLLGTTYSASTLATGYGAYIALPLLRKAVEGRETTLTEAEATDIMETCMKVLFYRDARSLNKVCSYSLRPLSFIDI